MTAQHRLSKINEDSMTGVCAVCGPVPIRRKKDGNVDRYIFQCLVKRRQERKTYRKPSPSLPVRHRLGATCVRCGFVPEDPCQLQIDHVVAKWKGGTDRKDNLQTLCANCHCLKTKIDRAEWFASPAGVAWLARLPKRDDLGTVSREG